MADAGALNATVIGAAAEHDPQLRVPVWPRLRRGLHLDFTEEGMVVTGTPRRQALKGRSATDLLPKLLELLDGAHSHEALASELHVPQSTVFKALSLLWTSGIVEDIPREGSEIPPDFSGRLADYLSRIGDATGTNAAWEESVARIAAARVEIFGLGALPEMIRSELGANIQVSVSTGLLPGPKTTLALWVDDGSDTGEDLATHCWEVGVPLLRVRRHGRTLEAGPFVDPGFTACLACRTAADDDDDRPAHDCDDVLLSGLVAHEIFAFVSRTTSGLLPQFWRRIDLDTLDQTRLSGSTRPGCPRCSIADGKVTAAPPSVRYESTIALPPKKFADLKAHQAHYKPSNLAIQHVQRDWPLSPEQALPDPSYPLLDHPLPLRDSGTGPAPGSRPPGVEELAVLLAVMAGFQAQDEERVWRWTPSGGNIGSVVAYPVIRDVPGIPAGVYGYVPARNRLALIRSSVDDVPGDPPISLILVGDLAKVAQKYGDTALRLCFLDSGCAQAAAHHVATTLGLHLSPRADWDDHRVADALRINAQQDVITAVFDVGVGE